jgi:uncharacterized protein YoxC
MADSTESGTNPQLEQTVNSLKSEVNNLKSDITSLKNTVNSLSPDVDNVESSVSTLNSRLNTVVTNVTKLDASVTTLTRVVNGLPEDITTVLSSENKTNRNWFASYTYYISSYAYSIHKRLSADASYIGDNLYVNSDNLQKTIKNETSYLCNNLVNQFNYNRENNNVNFSGIQNNLSYNFSDLNAALSYNFGNLNNILSYNFSDLNNALSYNFGNLNNILGYNFENLNINLNNNFEYLFSYVSALTSTINSRFNSLQNSLHVDIALLITILTKKYDNLIETLSNKLTIIDKTLNRRVPNKKELMYEVTSEIYKYSNFDYSSPNDVAKKSLHKSNLLWNELVRAKVCDGDEVEIKEDVRCQSLTILDNNNKTVDNNATITLKVNESKQLKAVLSPSNVTVKTVDWQSMDEETVTVNNGLLKAGKDENVTVVMISTTDGTAITKNITIKVIK